MQTPLRIIGAMICLVMFVGCAQPTSQNPAPKKKDKTDNQTGTKPPKSPVDTVTPGGEEPNQNPVDPNEPPVKNPDPNEPPTTTPGTGEPKGPDPKDPMEPNPNSPDISELIKNLNSGLSSDGYWLRSGYVSGWAVDKRDLKNYLEVRLYAGGDNKSGKLVWKQTANLVGSDDNNGGEHAFSKAVGEEFRTGTPVSFYLYAVMDGNEVPFTSKMPLSLTLFKPMGGAGLVAFRKTSIQSKCGACHKGVGSTPQELELDFYNIFWNKLFSEGTSGAAWGATTNHLYEKINGNHRALSGSKNLCSGYIDCKTISEWWNTEFKK